MLSKKIHLKKIPKQAAYLDRTFSNRSYVEPVAKYELGKKGMHARVAQQIVLDELNLDGNPSLNLATFVTTWMEPEIKEIVNDALNKNYVDQDEYPQTVEIQNRCVNILARLFNIPDHETGIGTATVGSSEAIHLCGLSLKWQWRDRRVKEGKTHDKPNIVMGQNVQVCWEKFARYFEVEPRYVPLTEDRFI